MPLLCINSFNTLPIHIGHFNFIFNFHYSMILVTFYGKSGRTNNSFMIDRKEWGRKWYWYPSCFITWYQGYAWILQGQFRIILMSIDPNLWTYCSNCHAGNLQWRVIPPTPTSTNDRYRVYVLQWLLETPNSCSLELRSNFKLFTFQELFHLKSSEIIWTCFQVPDLWECRVVGRGPYLRPLYFYTTRFDR